MMKRRILMPISSEPLDSLGSGRQWMALYCNRKGRHSYQLLAVCDHNLKFLYCYTGEVGSMHDNRVLQKSGLIEDIESGNYILHQLFMNFIVNFLSFTSYLSISGRKPMYDDGHLLADLGYPLKPWCMTSYKRTRPLSVDEENFNTRLSECRTSIERAFALLKGKFRRLKYIENVIPDLISGIIIGCCILHNICIGNEFTEELELESDDEEEDGEQAENTNAANKRDIICAGIRDGLY